MSDTAGYRYSLYGLIAQLVLEGKSNPKLSYHTMTVTPQIQSQLQRFTIQCNREKLWVCSSSHNAAPALGSAGPAPSVMYHNIGKYLADNVATLPTLYMQIAWDASVEMQGGVAFHPV